MMYREPSDSPWGLVVRCDTLCPGVYSVSTAGHGGIMAQIDAARQLLSLEAQQVGFQAGGYLNFEEDCNRRAASIWTMIPPWPAVDTLYTPGQRVSQRTTRPQGESLGFRYIIFHAPPARIK